MGQVIQVVEGPVAHLDVYATIPISFVVSKRLDVDQLWLGEFAEISVEPWTKDYDSLEPIATLASRFDVGNWRMVWAEKGKKPVNAPEGLPLLRVPSPNSQLIRSESLIGGAILAWNTPEILMLEGRTDLAILWDIRVHPLYRGQGLGTALFDQAKSMAKKLGCVEMRIETQNTNVDACKFYRQMGCRLHSIHENAYDGLDETKLIWTTRV
jgi:ribosomal protein S18 acetylase RimI-like enzyme